MPAFEIEVPTPDGLAAVSIRTPEGDGPWPGVILYPDVGGRRPTFGAMAERLASFGYVVLVPDIYHRNAPWDPFDAATVWGDQEELTRMFGLAGSINPDHWAADAEAFVEYLIARPDVVDGPVGTTGYCFGGRISLTVAGRLGRAVGAAASFHGGGLVSDDPTSPHLLAPRVEAQVYVGGARDDGSFTTEQAATLDAAYAEAGVVHTIETYDALHGFAVPDNPTFDEAASERHWAALDEFYGSALAPG